MVVEESFALNEDILVGTWRACSTIAGLPNVILIPSLLDVGREDRN
jgi:hypothetical protein